MATAVALILASTIALPIQSVPPSQLPRPYGYPETRPPELVEEYSCFMQTADGRGLDLRGMCNGTRQQAGVNRVANPVGANRSGGGASRATGSSGRSRSSGSSGGNCPTANSRAADGSRCGGRAASSRSGGR